LLVTPKARARVNDYPRPVFAPSGNVLIDQSIVKIGGAPCWAWVKSAVFEIPITQVPIALAAQAVLKTLNAGKRRQSEEITAA